MAPAMPMKAKAQSKGSGADPYLASYKERLQEMQTTANKMHEVLNRMRTRAGSNAAKSQQDDLEMWRLMLEDMDHTLGHMRAVVAEREDIEARRAAMYAAAMARQGPSGKPAASQQPVVTTEPPAQPAQK
jgi:hypothetical protein